LPRYQLSENAGKADPAKLFAIIVLDTGDRPITTPEKQVRI
jgi:hypothetical protein